MRQLIIFILMSLVVALVTSNSAIASSSRHAVLVYDADNGRVLHEENGSAQRYPASLTKMMTLYLLFEQMERGTVKLNTPMNISALAASQPQTNISLRRGGRLTAQQAIGALVVRSANDVAVVVAEHVGGSVARFAQIATAKARTLGMMRTRFKNPHGLPDNGQVTTAHDMALLGAALRRDFPQYFPYFSTKEFMYQGRRYGSHNRVVGRLKGVDGIKTGYINASGFNVVSSFKHDGFNIVAVVMGGNTAAERDNRMVALLQRMHGKLAMDRKNGQYPNKNQTNYASNHGAFSPRPTAKPMVNNREIVNGAIMVRSPIQQQPKHINVAMAGASLNRTPLAGASMLEAKNMDRRIINANYQVAQKNIAQGNIVQRSIEQRNVTTPPPAISADKGWAVQVGVFREAESAKTALKKIASKVRNDLSGAIAYVEYSEHGTNILHRARLKNLSQQSATTVCQKLQNMSQDCFVTKIN